MRLEQAVYEVQGPTIVFLGGWPAGIGRHGHAGTITEDRIW